MYAVSSSKNHDEFYTYDRLHRLTNAQRGDLTGGPPPTGIAGTPVMEQDYSLDETGNWKGFVESTGGTVDLNQTRYHNTVNEIAGNGGNPITASTGADWEDPEYDAAGNLTTMPQQATPTSTYTAVYDAWNRLVAVDDGGAHTVVTFAYDGLNRRIVTVDYEGHEPNFERHYYYNNRWQLLEERQNAETTADMQYVWGPRYVDELVLQDRDAAVRWHALSLRRAWT